MGRGRAVSIKGLPKSIRAKFRRAVIFSGARSQSAWLARAIRRLIRQQEEKYGDLLTALTPDELDIIEAIQSGANDPEHIAEEMMMPPGKLDLMLDDLVERGALEVRRQGGKTDQARGARRPLYFVTEKYQSKTE
jgi:DNA-binding MarR family transcriptional regulator